MTSIDEANQMTSNANAPCQRRRKPGLRSNVRAASSAEGMQTTTIQSDLVIDLKAESFIQTERHRWFQLL